MKSIARQTRLLSSSAAVLPRPFSPSPPTNPATLPPFSPKSPPTYGQPLHHTHPHLLAQGETTPGIQAAEYEKRRADLMGSERFRAGDCVLIAGGRLKYMTANIFYKFRQSSNFWYLTGWEEPDSFLVLQKTSDAKGYKSILFVQSKDPSDEIWNGPRSGGQGATSEHFNIDEAYDITLLSSKLKSLFTGKSSADATIYTDVPGLRLSTKSRILARRDVGLGGRVGKLLDYLVPASGSSVGVNDLEDVVSVLEGAGNWNVKSVVGEVEKLRLIKSAAEIGVMRKAARISAKAHTDVMKFIKKAQSSGIDLTENSLVSHFEYQTALLHAPRPSYVPVCASGPSALTLHYTSNNLPLVPSSLILLDAGAEYGGYCSDITRMFPVDGKFSGAQRDLYEVVLRVEKECIKLCSEVEGVSLDDLHRKSMELMRGELGRLGFTLRGGELERIYPHFLSHPLGIDLHDTPTFSRSEKIKENMCITIEPGLYIPDSDAYPAAFRGMGIRVEDEVIVGSTEYEVLSVNAPKEVVDIEFCMNR